MNINIPPFDMGQFVLIEGALAGWLSPLWLSNLSQLYQALMQMAIPYNGLTITGNTTITPWSTYINNAAGQTQFLLPKSAQVGMFFRIIGFSAPGFVIKQNALQNIQVGGSTTTTGTGGSVTSNAAGDCLGIYCAVANTNFIVADFSPLISNFTVV